MGIQDCYPQTRRPSPAERLQMVEQFQRSGLTRVAFAQQYGIPLATLSWWLAKAKRAADSPPPLTFSEIRLVTSPPAESGLWEMEVEGPSGVIRRSRVPLCIKDLARLLRGWTC